MASAYKYFKQEIQTSTYAWFKLVDKNGVIVKDYSNHPCYSGIYSWAIPPETETIVVYREKTMVPYSEDVIARFVSELNQIGFPCSLEVKEKEYEVIVRLKDYTNKPHMLGTLTLLRCMWELNMCQIADVYLQLIEKHPGVDKLRALQWAHKHYKLPTTGRYPAGHMVTYKGNGFNISKKTLFERYEKSGVDMYGSGYASQNNCWKGSGIKSWWNR